MFFVFLSYLSLVLEGDDLMKNKFISRILIVVLAFAVAFSFAMPPAELTAYAASEASA